MLLRGGWHYRRFPSGVVSKIPVKDPHSHPADALSYGVCELLNLSVSGLVDPYAGDIYADDYTDYSRAEVVGRSSVTGY